MSDTSNQNIAAGSVALDQQQPELVETALKLFWTYIRPFWWLYVCGVGLALLGALIFLMTATPRYSSSCRMHVSLNETRVVKVEGITDPGSARAGSVFMNTQIMLMGGSEMLGQAYRSLGLTDDQYELFSTPTITPVRDTNLIDISVSSSDRELAAKVANALANTYIESLRNRRVKISSSGSELLRDQLDDVGRNYDKAVQALLDYKHENSITSLDVNYQQIQTQIEAKLERIEEAENRAADIELSLTEINKHKDLATIMLPYLLSGDGSSGENSGTSGAMPNTLFTLQTMLLEHQMNLPELLARYGEANQSVRVHHEVTEMIKQASIHEVDTCIKGLEMRRERILKSVTLMRAQLDALNKRLEKLDQLSGEYKRREAAVDALGKSVEMLTARMNEIQINDAVNKLDDYAVFIVSAAEPAFGPYFPIARNVIAMAIVAGLALAGAASFLIVALNNKIDDVRSVAALFGPQMPVFGNIPHFDEEELKKNRENVDGVVDEVFRNIRTALNLSLATRNNKIMAITSGLQDAGKTMISTTLARSFAREKKRVLLIDMDLRKSGVTHMLNDVIPEKARKRGVSNVLVGDCQLDDIVVHLDKFGFDLAPVGPIPPNPSELLSQPSLTTMLKEAEGKYDQILIDTSPFLQVSDALMIVGQKIPFILVVNRSRMTRPLANSLCEQLRQVSLLPAGIIGNNTTEPKNTTGYGKYGYGYGYGKYGKYGYGKYGKYGYGYGKYGYGYGKTEMEGKAEDKK